MSEVLDARDLASPCWQKIRAHLEARITQHRIANDRHSSEIDTARLRGRIAECLSLLTLGEKPNPIELEQDTY